MLRLLLVDEQRMFVEALTQYLSTESDLWVADSSYPSETDLLERARIAWPDIAVVDIAVLGTRVHEVLRRLEEVCPDVRVVVLTSTVDSDLAVRAARAGAAAWLPKERGISELVEVLRLVGRGHAWYPPEVLGEVLCALRREAGPAGTDHDPLAVLSVREREVLAVMAEGKRGRQIAAELFISVQTVRKHTRGILTKLNVHTQLEAAMLASSGGEMPALAETAVRALPR
ncbi:two component transcriptional regulator, LuxR family [Actinopolyspora mzabensis]|uniref:Two component transcriptional regulator, LuxR family n=1 Tax=Actinopolyspora mzabensis TaxID=995066 RepID=A0A1G8ZCW0_ACTMZ|nr:response regulator transcription factor [Actinopolyspora mzabensis]SDK12848.1 two component transcriptional regulator, LuxR family [Actinopolyspora mzabensis]